MSAWGEMRHRSSGKEQRKEDIVVFYYDNDSAKKPIVIVEEKHYKDYHYMICTAGDYPILDIRVKSENTDVFGGYQVVILKLPDKSYELDRMILPKEGMVKYLYEFNKDGDYNHNSSYKRCTEDGHKYTVSEVEDYAEKFIDEIIKCENDLHRELENNVYEKRIII